MADPISIVGLVASTVQLISFTGKAALGLRTLATKYHESARFLNTISQECSVIEAAISQLKAWIESSLQHIPGYEQSVQPLKEALDSMSPSLKALASDVERILSRSDDGNLSSKDKLKTIWEEDVWKGYLDEVRWQSQHLHLLLSTTTLTQAESIAQVRNLNKAASIHYSLDTDTVSVLGKKEFDFDNEVMNSVAYRRVLIQEQKRNEPNEYQKRDASLEEPSKQHKTISPPMNDKEILKEFRQLFNGINLVELRDFTLATQLEGVPKIDVAEEIARTKIDPSTVTLGNLITSTTSDSDSDDEGNNDEPGIEMLVVGKLCKEAQQAIYEGAYSEAEKMLRSALKQARYSHSAASLGLSPSHITLRLAFLYGETGNFEKFDDILHPFVAEHNDIVQILRLDSIYTLLKKAIYATKDNLTHAEKLFRLAESRFALLEDHMHHISKNDITLELAYVCFCQGKWKELEEVLKLGVARNQDPQRAVLQAIAQYAQGNMEEAEALLRQSIKRRQRMLKHKQEPFNDKFLKFPITLIAFIYRKMGDENTAKVYLSLLEKPRRISTSRNSKLFTIDEIILNRKPKQQAARHVLNPKFKPRTKVRCLKISPDSSLIAYGMKDYTIDLYDVKQNKVVHQFSKTYPMLDCIAFSPDCRLLAFYSVHEGICIIDVEKRHVQHNLRCNKGLSSIQFSFDGKVIAATSGNGNITTWSALTGEIQAEMKHENLPIHDMAFSYNGRYLLSCNRTKYTTLSTIGEEPCQRSVHSENITAVAFSSNSLIAFGSENGTVQIKDSELRSVQTLKIPGSIHSMNFSPDGTLLACGISESAVSIWDIRKGAQIATESSLGSNIAFTPTGESILCGGHSDATIWNFEQGLSNEAESFPYVLKISNHES